MCLVQKNIVRIAGNTHQPLRHKAAQEMRVGPSKSACRSRFQTASRCLGLKGLKW